MSLDVTLPLVRFGLLAAWLLIFMIFEREYSTAVYLLSPGTEVIGALLVSLWATGADQSPRFLSSTSRWSAPVSAWPCVSE